VRGKDIFIIQVKIKLASLATSIF